MSQPGENRLAGAGEADGENEVTKPQRLPAAKRKKAGAAAQARKLARALAGETLVRAGLKERAAKHNLDAVLHGRHFVQLAPDMDSFLCTNCGKVQPRTVKHITFLAARCDHQ